jgi:hypothetical protein
MRAAAVILLASSILVVVMMVRAGSANPAFQFDFKGDLYVAGRAIVHHESPYKPTLLQAEAIAVRAGRLPRPVASPRWPPPPLLASVPLSLLPFPLAGWGFLVFSISGLGLGLRLLGVRDWRCIAVALLSWPALFGAWLGNVSPLLLLGTAVAWRYRSRVVPLAIAVASVVATKLFLWPLAIWLYATRRIRAMVMTLVIAAAGILAAWALIGFAGLTAYPQMLVNIATIGEAHGSSLVALLLSLGMPVSAARAVSLGTAGALLCIAIRLGRLPDGDRQSLGLALLAALTATPVVWAHYLVLLYIPIALLAPRISAIWFVPMLAFLSPLPVAHPHVWSSLPELLVELVIAVWLCGTLLNRSPVAVKAARLLVADPVPTK